MSYKSKGKWKRLMGLWLHKSNGKFKNMSGRVWKPFSLDKGDKLCIFPNTYKDKEKDPTHNLCLFIPDEDSNDSWDNSSGGWDSPPKRTEKDLSYLDEDNEDPPF